MAEDAKECQLETQLMRGRGSSKEERERAIPDESEMSEGVFTLRH